MLFRSQVTDKWKLGDAKKDNGVLFLISVTDRKMRIEVGQGLEGVLPDILAGRIIEEVKPYFKIGRFDEGISIGSELIIKSLKGEKIPEKDSSNGHFPFIQIFVLIIFIIWSLLRRFFWIFPSMGGRRSGGFYSGGGFGGGGGGGWSGGGGGFSGGGASGNW